MTVREPVPSTLPGVRWGSLVRHSDARGSFREIWRASALGDLDPGDAGSPPDRPPRFVQANLSVSAPGVLRGLHYHRRQLDYWTVASGKAFVALVDLRPRLSVSGPVQVETRTLAADSWVVVPAGVAHGFLALETVELLYLVTNEFDGNDELGFAWDDPMVGVPWPTAATPDGKPVVSARDRTNPSLDELLASLRS